MSYYAYEYGILMGLNDELKIESISIDAETWNITKTTRNEFRKLENEIVKVKGEDTIRLNFANDFHYEFCRKFLREAYGQGHNEEFMISQLKRDIQKKFLDKFINR